MSYLYIYVPWVEQDLDTRWRYKLKSSVTQNFQWIFSLARTVHLLEQCFSTFFDSRHPSSLNEQFGGTPNYNLPLNRRQIHILAAPQEFFTATKGSAATRLRTTVLECINPIFKFLKSSLW